MRHCEEVVNSLGFSVVGYFEILRPRSGGGGFTKLSRVQLHQDSPHTARKSSNGGGRDNRLCEVSGLVALWESYEREAERAAQMTKNIFGWFLLILSAGSAVTLFIRSIDYSVGESKSERGLSVLWVLFLLCGIIGLLLLGVIPSPRE